MPQGRIQPQRWFVEFELPAAPASPEDCSYLEQPIEVPPSDSKIRVIIRLYIKDVMPAGVCFRLVAAEEAAAEVSHNLREFSLKDGLLNLSCLLCQPLLRTARAAS